jgi:hypothetical protein
MLPALRAARSARAAQSDADWAKAGNTKPSAMAPATVMTQSFLFGPLCHISVLLKFSKQPLIAVAALTKCTFCENVSSSPLRGCEPQTQSLSQVKLAFAFSCPGTAWDETD